MHIGGSWFSWEKLTICNSRIHFLLRYTRSILRMYHMIRKKQVLENLRFSVQSLSCVWFFLTPRDEAHQAILSITNSLNLLKLMSIESVMPFKHLILHCPLLLLPSICPNIKVFYNDFSSWHQVAKVMGASASASVLPMNIQDNFH